MSEMVERVAKAIYEGRNGAGCKPWGRLPSGHKQPYLGDARAAIEAMRNPTLRMLIHGLDAMSVYELEPLLEEFTLGYKAAIDAALKDAT